VIGYTADQRIRKLRAPKPAVDPWRAHGSLVEDERRPDGRIERALTVFLAGAECPYTCSFCDLWRWTIDGPTPAGALVWQLKEVLDATPPPVPDRVKLYNASNFFDQRAVPVEDLPAIAALAAPFGGVTVESHARTVGPRMLEFARMLSGSLEVAIGLETTHPAAMEHLNKRLSLTRFAQAAGSWPITRSRFEYSCCSTRRTYPRTKRWSGRCAPSSTRHGAGQRSWRSSRCGAGTASWSGCRRSATSHRRRSRSSRMRWTGVSVLRLPW